MARIVIPLKTTGNRKGAHDGFPRESGIEIRIPVT
jgi:hypothetical protein